MKKIVVLMVNECGYELVKVLNCFDRDRKVFIRKLCDHIKKGKITYLEYLLIKLFDKYYFNRLELVFIKCSSRAHVRFCNYNFQYYKKVHHDILYTSNSNFLSQIYTYIDIKKSLKKEVLDEVCEYIIMLFFIEICNGKFIRKNFAFEESWNYGEYNYPRSIELINRKPIVSFFRNQSMIISIVESLIEKVGCDQIIFLGNKLFSRYFLLKIKDYFNSDGIKVVFSDDLKLVSISYIPTIFIMGEDNYNLFYKHYFTYYNNNILIFRSV